MTDGFPTYRHPAPERDAVEALQWLIRENPTLLPPAPDDFDGVATNRRARGGTHMCLLCGGRAWVAYIAGTTSGTGGWTCARRVPAGSWPATTRWRVRRR
jgi:hypothetical protein